MSKTEDRLRILVVADGKPAKGGISSYAHTLVDDCFNSGDIHIELLNTTRAAEWKGGALSLSNLRRGLVDPLRVFDRARRVDVVHLQTALLPLLPLLRVLSLLLAARLARREVLVHVHTGQANEGPHEGFEPSRTTRFLLARLASANRVLVVSEAGRRGLEKYLPPDRIVRVDNGVRAATWPAPEPTSPPVILYAGAINRAKGLLDLARALASLRDGGLNEWEVEVVGGSNQTGDEEALTVRRAFEAEGWSDAFRGVVEARDMPERYRRASLFVMPSYSEGQPISILEAMAAGLPVIATRVGAVPDVVLDNETGIIIDPGSPEQLAAALRTLLEDQSLRARMGASARRRALDRYDLRVMERNLGELYWKAARADR